MLKYDQTGEALQPPGEAGDGDTAESSCSVLTPEQIYSQLSMVLQHSGPAEGTDETAVADNGGTQQRKKTAVVTTTNAKAAPVSSASRGKPTKAKRARERKARKGEQPKRAKETDAAGTGRVEKRPRRRLRQTRSRRVAERQPLVEPSTVELGSNEPLPTSTNLHQHVHVVEISPEKPSLDEIIHNPPRTSTDASARPTSAAKVEQPSTSVEESSEMEVNGPQTTPSDHSTVTSNTGSSDSDLSTEPMINIAAVANRLSRYRGFLCRPLNYELLGRLIGEPILTSFYLSFNSSRLSEHLKIELLDPLGGGDSVSSSGPENLPRWLQITHKHMHIDPNLGPIPLSRLLVSNAGIVKFQHLFPFAKTVFMRHVKSCDLGTILSELNPRRVLCAGLPEYPKHHVILGYHPADVRILHTQTPNYQRFDHKLCPILHVPRQIRSAEKTHGDNMCSKCSHLHESILKLICDKLSRINARLAEREHLTPDALPKLVTLAGTSPPKRNASSKTDQLHATAHAPATLREFGTCLSLIKMLKPKTSTFVWAESVPNVTRCPYFNESPLEGAESTYLDIR